MAENNDRDRDYYLYRYILGRLAISYKSDGSPNANKTSSRVNGTDALRKLLPYLLTGKKDWHTAIAESRRNRPTKATTGYVVDMLATLRQTLKEEYESDGLPYSRLLTSEDILTALYQLVELTREEREQLALPAGDSLTLLNQILLMLQSQGGIHNEDVLLRTYKEIVGISTAADTPPINSLDDVDQLIDRTVEMALGHIPNRGDYPYNTRAPVDSREKTVRDLAQKAKREVRRLLTRSGNTQAFFVDSAAEHPYIRQYLSSGFVTKLARTVVENERLTAQFPVYLRQITARASGPLPFADTNLARLYPLSGIAQ